MKQQLRVSSETDALKLEVWDHGRKLVPTSGTITIYSNEAQVSDIGPSSVSIGSDGACTYTPGTALTSDYQMNGRAEWLLGFAGSTKRYVQLFDVVQYPIWSQITDDDLIGECGELQSQRYKHYGAAESGSPSEVICQALKDYPDDHWTGGIIEVVDGPADGDVRVVSDSVQSTGTITVSTGFSAAITASSEFVVKRTFQREIDRAFEDMLADVEARGYRPSLIIGSEDLKSPHVCLALEKICRNMARSTEDVWWARGAYYRDEYDARMTNRKWVYDSDEDKEPDSEVVGRIMFRR